MSPIGVHDAGKRRGIVVEVVHRLGVGAHDPEVRARKGGKTGESINCCFRIDFSPWIRILRYTPNPSYGSVTPDSGLDLVHIRTIVAHRHVHHVNAEIFEDGKVSVISRYGA